MSWEDLIKTHSFKANEDLSSDQYRFVIFEATNKQVRRPDSAGEKAIGVLQDKPAAAARAASVAVAGFTKVVAGATLAVGDEVYPEYVSAADAGKAAKVASPFDLAHGIVVEGAAEDELATIWLYGSAEERITTGMKKEYVSIPLTLTANSTVVTGCYAATRAVKVTAISIAAKQVPADADGVCTLAVTNYDKSATADDNLLGAATFDLEGIAAAKEAEDLTLTSTGADLILAAGDMIRAEVVNDSAAIDTAMLGGVLTFELEPLS